LSNNINKTAIAHKTQQNSREKHESSRWVSLLRSTSVRIPNYLLALPLLDTVSCQYC